MTAVSCPCLSYTKEADPRRNSSLLKVKTLSIKNMGTVSLVWAFKLWKDVIHRQCITVGSMSSSDYNCLIQDRVLLSLHAPFFSLINLDSFLGLFSLQCYSASSSSCWNWHLTAHANLFTTMPHAYTEDKSVFYKSHKILLTSICHK